MAAPAGIRADIQRSGLAQGSLIPVTGQRKTARKSARRRKMQDADDWGSGTIARWLHDKAVELFPESDSARRHAQVADDTD